ncbi:MAG: hypothetical protein KDA05_03005 [Phycisphaerales bacterium]|nr:hypothetical protein [Phycisphaerales bacterium]MCB9841342.1 hypothetical protein [Phycisphaeraceae bacterium]
MHERAEHVDDPGVAHTPRPRVLIAEALDRECVAWLAERATIDQIAPGGGGFDEALRRAEAMIVRTYVRVDRAMLERGPRLRVVGRAGVGLDNIDVEVCAARGVRVVHTPGANTRAVVEFVLGEVLDAFRPRAAVDRALAPSEWAAARAAAIAPREIGELTLGILGLGRIGSAVARAAGGFGMRLLYHDLREITPDERNGAVPVAIEELLREADVLSIHVDGRASNRGLVAASMLGHLKPSALLINTSRGLVVDAPALAAWLRSNAAAGGRAVLDVHEPEPFGTDYPLLGLANVRLTPHIASATASAKRAMSWVVREVWEALAEAC